MRCLSPWLAALFLLPVVARAAEVELKPPAANSPTEAAAAEASLAKAGAFLDAAALNWTQKRNCVTCHTNMPYLFAQPLTGKGPTPAAKEVRAWFENQVAGWEDKNKPVKPKGPAYVVATAAALAINDAFSTGKLSVPARQALDRMWAVQAKDGGWDWIKCDWPPLEHDDYYGAVLAAVAVGLAPDGYAQGDSAKDGLGRLRAYLKKNAPPTMHHKAWLLWASLKLDGLMTDDERRETVKELRALQKDDGGWSLPSLGEWKGYDGRPNNKAAGSDGYATGLVVFILREAGVGADDAAVRKGAAWLKGNQRESGRWFTQSLNTDRYHFISHAGTAFAVMALKRCEER